MNVRFKQLMSLLLVVISINAIADEKSVITLSPGGTIPLIAADLDRGIIDRYTINIDLSALYDNASLAPTSDKAEKRIQTEGINNIFIFHPDESESPFDAMTLQITSIGNYVEGVDTFYGSINNSAVDSFSLSVMDEQLFGYLHYGSQVLEVSYDANLNSHVLTVTDLKKKARDIDLFRYDRKATNSKRHNLKDRNKKDSGEVIFATESIGGNGNIRILVIYTEDVGDENNIYTLTANFFAEMNASLNDSDVDHDVVVYLAGLIEDDDNLDNLCKDDILDLAQARDEPFDTLDSRMSSNDADVALIIATEESYSCTAGYDRIGGIAGAIFEADEPYAVVMDTYVLGDRSGHHEIGHVFGGHHEIEELDWCLQYYSESFCFPEGDGTTDYSLGYVGSNEEWQTIMGAYYECDFVALPGTPDCVRVNKWSNPSINYSGESTGVSGESDMESSLEIHAVDVAAWDSYPTSTPTGTPTLTVVSGLCFGANTLAWTSVSGADHYQLFESASSSFTGPSRIYVGTGLGIEINIDYMSTSYFRVRACNGNGCGPNSTIKSASYYNGCI